MKILLYALKGLFRKPNTLRKIVIFAFIALALYLVSNLILVRLTDNIVLKFAARWVWLPFTVLFLIIRHGEPMKRRNYYRFFEQVSLVGYDDRLPEYLWSVPHNEYITKIRFCTKVPLAEWEKVKSKIEVYHNKKIYKIENLEEDLTMLDIYLIVEKLPKFIAWSDDLMVEGRRFVIGESYKGREFLDLTATPHALVAGASGGGKTTILRCIIHQATQKRFNVSVLDFKGGGDYSGIEQENIISDPEEARNLLQCLTGEVKSRAEMFKSVGVSNIDEYNAGDYSYKLVPWLLVIDEAAEILDVKPKTKEDKELYSEIDQYLRTLARTSRAAGVHILMGLIRPDSNVIDGQIKNNLLFRACGYFPDPAASRIVLDNDKATSLPPNVKGRFIIGEDEVQAYYLPMPKNSKE
ncbi:MAG: FtsK/SpoIIIE domain-containing protein [Oscillospiraceae bacterium]|nr:FtsK/SpoIIIE domain-containing protein [Oscillospiraceae bacterium]